MKQLIACVTALFAVSAVAHAAGRAPDHVLSALNVVSDGVRGVFLHQGHVLVRCRVEHGMGPEAPEHAPHPRQIAYIRKQLGHSSVAG